MATIGSLVIELKAETAALRKDLGRVRRDMNRFARQTNRSLGGISSGFAKAGRSAKAFVAVLAARAGVQGLDQILASVSDLADSSEKLGLTTDRLQELRFAAEQNSIPINRLDTAIQRFTRRVGEARLGSGELVNTLRQYGIEVTDARGRTRDVSAVLGDLAEVVKNADSDTERLRISFKAFDSEGASLVNILRDGRVGLEEWSRAAQDAGAVIDADLVQRGRETNRVWRRVANVIGVQAKTAVIELTDVLREAGENVRVFAESGRLRVFETETVPALETLGAQLHEMRGAADLATLAMENLTAAGTSARVRGGVGDLAREIEATTEQARAMQAAFDSLSASQVKGLDLPIPGAQGATPATLPPSADEIAAADRIRGVTEDLRFQAEQLSRTAEAQRLYNELRRAQVDLDSASGQEIARLVAAIQAQEQAQRVAVEASRQQIEASDQLIAETARAAREYEQGMETIRRSSERAFGDLARDILSGENAMEGLANAARRTVDAIVSEFLRLAVIKPLIAGIFGGFGGGAGPQFTGTGPVGRASSGSFQHGGSFIADGPGGTDAIAARLNLTKGERVTVETSAQQRQGRGGGDTFIIDARGADSGGLARLEALIKALHGSIERRAVGAIVEARARDPALFQGGF